MVTRDAYQRKRQQASQRERDQTRAGQDIGALPRVAKPRRRKRAERDFRFFCETYFPDLFHLKWSDDHYRVLDRIEEAVLHGGLFAMAMPRGSGKTTLCEVACLWAILIGASSFVCLIGSDEASAQSMLASIKTQLEVNDLLNEDFPEACYPIRALEGSARRCEGQRYRGERTYIGWRANELILPTIPGAKCSGAVVRVTGLTGHFRGMKATKPDGSSIRPSLVLIDDPQTDESARSPSQCASRESLLSGAVLGLAGPGQKIAGLLPCTVIRQGDLADTILDREKHPQWQGERTKMVYAFPANEKLWEEYRAIREDSFRAGRRGEEATRFYRKNRKAMDVGAKVAWPARHHDDELSAIQHAMNLRFRDEAAFFAEYQNEPLDETADADLLTADEIAAKVSGYRREVIPAACNRLTMFIDVHKPLLYWEVCGWEDGFTGHVISYGTWPDQRRRYFTLRDARKTLGRAFPKAGMEGAIFAGVAKIYEQCMAVNWRREDGAAMPVDLCLIDANWGQSTDVVYRFCRQHARIMPSHGKYLGASSNPIGPSKPGRRVRGERAGLNLVTRYHIERKLKYVLYDTNFWKSFAHARLAVPMGDPGCVSLFAPADHRMFAEHQTAEAPVRTEGRGRTVDEWKLLPNGGDNHFLDCHVGNHVAASILGVTLEGLGHLHTVARPKKKLSEIQRAKRRG